ncbi:MAG: hypothetical protein IID58_13960 [Proteobacteria bacterium]|nr:hypothetical protein [Pseudomonadota bacterium]
MKIISYLPLMLVPLVAACGSQPYVPAAACVSAAQITITPSRAAVSAVPANFCAKRGDTIKIKVAGSPKKGSISTTPKLGKNTWLSGSNASKAGEFELYVNDDVTDGTYKYTVNTQSGVVLDPRVTIER